MLKCYELIEPTSCLNKAHETEMVFVLLARDQSAPVAIRMWAASRVALGLNAPDDPQIVDALNCAVYMESQHEHFMKSKRNQIPLPDSGPERDLHD